LAAGYNNACHCNLFLYLLLLIQEMMHRLVYQTIINIKEDGCRRNTRYFWKNMISKAIIACKLQEFSSLEHQLKLKSMLNASSNKI
jgi:hypothetical protein